MAFGQFLIPFGLTYCKSTIRPVFAQNSTREKQIPFSIFHMIKQFDAKLFSTI